MSEISFDKASLCFDQSPATSALPSKKLETSRSSRKAPCFSASLRDNASLLSDIVFPPYLRQTSGLGIPRDARPMRGLSPRPDFKLRHYPFPRLPRTKGQWHVLGSWQ